MFKLIIHNVLKHWILFILIGFMVILLCFYLLIGLNTIFSISESLSNAVAKNMAGDVIIASKQAKFLDVITKDGEKKIIPLSDADQLLKFLREKKYVKNASPRLRVWGIVKSDYNEIPMILTGVDPKSEKYLLPNRLLISGRWLTNDNEIMMYYRHSDLLSISKGAVVGIGVLTVDGYQNFDTNTLVGVVDYTDLSYYSEFAYFGFVSISYLNKLLMTSKPEVSEIFISLNNPRDKRLMYKDIQSKFGDKYKYILPQESSNLVNGIYTLSQFVVWFVALLLIILIYLCSSFLVNISIETRRQEIGIYQALGVQKWRIGYLFAGEFLFVMVLFSIVGSIIGLTTLSFLAKKGIEATIIPLQLIFGRSVLNIKIYPITIGILLLVLFISFLGSVLSAIKKLSKLDPVEIMREL